MKLLVAAFFAILVVSAAAEEAEFWEIDWSTVVSVMDAPGFWEGRDPELQRLYDGSRSGRIVGGSIPAANSIPFQAGLLQRVSATQTTLCGGSLISTRSVLTAAHCPWNTQSTEVRLGAHHLHQNEPAQQRFNVATGGYRMHGNYNPSTLANDVAILILPGAASLTAQVQIVQRATGTATFAGQNAIASGWGVGNNGQTQQTLHHVTVPVITNAVCSQTLGNIIASTICTGGAGGIGTCGGDSGGPLFIGSGAGRSVIGITSFGPANCRGGFPSAYARVTSFAAWITSNML